MLGAQPRYADSTADGRLATARARVRQRRLHDAARCFSELTTWHETDADCWFEYGQVLLQLDYHERACRAFESALQRDACLARAWNERGVALSRLHRDDDARASFERACQLAPELAAAGANLATSHLNHGDLDRAVQLFRQTLALAPDHLEALLGLGRALRARGELADARRALQHALRHHPRSWDALLALAVFHLGQGALVEAERAAGEFLRQSPGHSGALGLLAELGRERGNADLGDLLDLRRWLWVQDLAVDPRWLHALSSAIVTHHSLTDSPPHHATENGRHSGALFGSEDALLREAEDHVAAALSAYYARLVRAPRGAGPLAPPGPVALNGWGVVLDGNGYQLPHLHPAAWLSGVLYVEVPERSPATASESGCLQLGSVDPALGLSQARPIEHVVPKPGRLVVFPSWLYHSTVPHRAEGIRVSLAFDCVRASRPRA